MGDKKVGTLTLGVQAQVKGFEGAIGGIAKMGLAISGVQKIAQIAMKSITNFTNAANEQELVNARLAAALETVGMNTESNFKTLEKYAAEIQGVTTVGDEATLGAMQLALNMGISFDKMREATQGAVGLAKAYKMDLKASMKVVALAMEGDYAMMSRFVPAMKGLKDQTKLAALAQKTMADGFKIAKAEAKTAGGQMEQYKNALGDVQQIIGSLMNEALLPLIKKMKELALSLSGQPELIRNVTKAVGGLIAAFGLMKITTFMIGMATFFKTTLPAALLAAKTAALGLGGAIGAIVIGLGSIIYFYEKMGDAQDEMLIKERDNAEGLKKIYDEGKEAREKLLHKTNEEIVDMENGLELLRADLRARKVAGLTLETEGLKVRNNIAMEGLKKQIIAVQELMRYYEELAEIIPMEPYGEERIKGLQEGLEGIKDYFAKSDLKLAEFEGVDLKQRGVGSDLKEIVNQTQEWNKELQLVADSFSVIRNKAMTMEDKLKDILKIILKFGITTALAGYTGPGGSMLAPILTDIIGSAFSGGGSTVININNPLLSDQTSYDNIANNVRNGLLKSAMNNGGFVNV